MFNQALGRILWAAWKGKVVVAMLSSISAGAQVPRFFLAEQVGMAINHRCQHLSHIWVVVQIMVPFGYPKY